MNAIVRPPGTGYVRALTAQQPRPTIDVSRARRQHADYCAALRAAGLDLIELPPDDSLPDACFVQDTAVVFGDRAVIGSFGIESRQGELGAIRQALNAAGRLRVTAIRPPATLEGGDVLAVGSRLFVGLSARSNRAGYAQLRDLLEIEGASVEALPVAEGLHLLSGVTCLGHGVLLATSPYAGLQRFAGLDIIPVPPDEAYAANALGVNGSVILPAGFPKTAAQVREHGFGVLPVDLSEFAKADGGATCLALLF